MESVRANAFTACRDSIPVGAVHRSEKVRNVSVRDKSVISSRGHVTELPGQSCGKCGGSEDPVPQTITIPAHANPTTVKCYGGNFEITVGGVLSFGAGESRCVEAGGGDYTRTFPCDAPKCNKKAYKVKVTKKYTTYRFVEDVSSTLYYYYPAEPMAGGQISCNYTNEWEGEVLANIHVLIEEDTSEEATCNAIEVLVCVCANDSEDE